MKWRYALIGLLLACVSAPGALAQRGVRDPLGRSLLTTRRMIEQGQLEEAITMLEAMLVDHPTDPRLILTLGEAYTRAGSHADAIELYRAQIERVGLANSEAWLRLVDACRQDGRGEEAMETLLEAIRRRPVWRGRLLDQFELVVTDSATSVEGYATLRQHATASDAPAIWRDVLAHVQVLTGHYEAALALLTRLDRDERAGGRRIFQLAQTLARRGEARFALAAFDSVLAQSPDPGLAEESWFEKAGLLVNEGRNVEAAAAYRTQFTTYPQGPLALRGRLKHAALLKDTMRDIPAAREAYTAILEMTRREAAPKSLRTIRDEAMLALGECALLTGDFAEADTVFAQLEATALRARTQEHAAYERAEILFYQGEFVAAEGAYFELTDRYPAGHWVNDALSRVLLLGEFGTRDPQALIPYAQIQYQRRIGGLERALALCREVLADTTQVLMRAHVRADEIRTAGDLGRWNEAEQALARLLEEDPGSRVCPAVLFWMGERAIGERAARSQECYEQVILRYPDSLPARRARARLAELRARWEQS